VPVLKKMLVKRKEDTFIAGLYSLCPMPSTMEILVQLFVGALIDISVLITS